MLNKTASHKFHPVSVYVLNPEYVKISYWKNSLPILASVLLNSHIEKGFSNNVVDLKKDSDGKYSIGDMVMHLV